jgi:uncharacterized protein DUF6894
MPRYYFHFMWPDDAVRDTIGVELEGFSAAYQCACGLVHQVRIRFPGTDENWWIEVSDGINYKPIVILPAMVPGAKLRRLRALTSSQHGRR